jgi:hypothetical protein
MWDAFETKFGVSDTGSELYVMEQFYDYKMVDDCPIVDQAHEIQSHAIKVEAIINSQGVWEAVSPTDGTTMDEKKNKTAMAQLLDALSEDILMQVSTKKMAKEVWDSLKTRFVDADRVKAVRLSTLHGELDKLYMTEGKLLDDYAGKISDMAARYASLGSTLGDTDMVKKLLDTVPTGCTTRWPGSSSSAMWRQWCSRRHWAGSRRSRNAHGGAADAEIVVFAATSPVTVGIRGRRRRSLSTSTMSCSFCRSRFRKKLLANKPRVCACDACV